MRRKKRRGITLVELLIAISIMAVVGVAAAAMLNACLQGYAYATSEKSELLREGIVAMERMTGGVRTCTHVRNYWATPGDYDILVFAGLVNDDTDQYFDDPLFPRIDEDAGSDMNSDNHAGIEGMDDDADGAIDEGSSTDDDEDGTADEDDQNVIYYYFQDDIDTLWEHFYGSSEWNDICRHVTDFTVTDEPSNTVHARRIVISLTLTNEAGEDLVFFEYAYPRNANQRTGKRVS